MKITLEQIKKLGTGKIITYKGAEALEAVKQNGDALKYVKEQTAEICLEAVKKYGDALKYVKEQTAEICLEAVKQDGDALRYVKEQTPEICLEAVKQNGYALQHVNESIFAKTSKVTLELTDEQLAKIKQILQIIKD